MTKNHHIGKKSPKWLKVLKLGFKGFQGVPDGSRSQTAWARTTRGTYAWAPYAFAALGQGPKGPELVYQKYTMLKILAFSGEDDEVIDVTIPAVRKSVVFFTRSTNQLIKIHFSPSYASCICFFTRFAINKV